MICRRPGCGQLIVGRRTNARYCSKRCKRLVSVLAYYHRHRAEMNAKRRLRRVKRRHRVREPDLRDRSQRYADNREVLLARAKTYYRRMRGKALAYDRLVKLMEEGNGNTDD